MHKDVWMLFSQWRRTLGAAGKACRSYKVTLEFFADELNSERSDAIGPLGRQLSSGSPHRRHRCVLFMSPSPRAQLIHRSFPTNVRQDPGSKSVGRRRRGLECHQVRGQDSCR